MRTVYEGAGRRVIIDPGEYYAEKGDLVISTLLGSCVAACLWDPVNRVIGMNHFLLANNRYSREMAVIASEAGRYGIHAMELLINEMLSKGAKRNLLRAKVFGGGNVLKGVNSDDNFFAVGDVNSRFIVEFLKNESIPLDSSNLGGDYGRVIHFLSSDYSVYMKRIEKSTTQQVVAKERKYFKHELVEHERDEQSPEGSIQFW